MRRNFLLASTLLLLCRTAAAADFEGQVDYSVTSQGRVQQLSFLVRGPKARIDVGGGQAGVDVDDCAGEVVTGVVVGRIRTDRLATLVTHGVLSRETYREEGSRAREEYRLTDAGRELQVVLGALQQWGDAHLPWPDGPTVLRCGPGGNPLHVGFVDDRGEQVDEVRFLPTAAYPGV
jgi:hypothetical protein